MGKVGLAHVPPFSELEKGSPVGSSSPSQGLCQTRAPTYPSAPHPCAVYSLHAALHLPRLYPQGNPGAPMFWVSG